MVTLYIQTSINKFPAQQCLSVLHSTKESFLTKLKGEWWGSTKGWGRRGREGGGDGGGGGWVHIDAKLLVNFQFRDALLQTSKKNSNVILVTLTSQNAVPHFVLSSIVNNLEHLSTNLLITPCTFARN